MDKIKEFYQKEDVKKIYLIAFGVILISILGLMFNYSSIFKLIKGDNYGDIYTIKILNSLKKMLNYYKIMYYSLLAGSVFVIGDLYFNLDTRNHSYKITSVISFLGMANLLARFYKVADLLSQATKDFNLGFSLFSELAGVASKLMDVEIHLSLFILSLLLFVVSGVLLYFVVQGKVFKFEKYQGDLS